MKDLTKLTEAFYLLDDETREALKAHGGPWEYLGVLGEWFDSDGGFTPGLVYRVKHVPLEGWFNVCPRTSIGPYPTEAKALENRGDTCIRTIFMREVTE
jgi:hypothetical protein